MNAKAMIPVGLLLALSFSSASVFAQVAPDGELVEITKVDHPSLVVGDKAFPLTVTLRSKTNEDVRAYLVGAVYAWEQGKAPCGSQVDKHWLGATHKSMGQVTIRPGQTVTYPSGPGSLPWWHVVNATWIADEPKTYEMCVFAVRPGTGSAPPLALDYHSFKVTGRGVNHAPKATFSHDPAEGNETYPVTFTAQATDADGDALRYAWDFGFFGAEGRATATGRVVRQAFYPADNYTVTLTVSDGFDATTVTKLVKILPEAVPAVPAPRDDPAPDGGKIIPALSAPAGLACLALAGALGHGARRRARRGRSR